MTPGPVGLSLCVPTRGHRTVFSDGEGTVMHRMHKPTQGGSHETGSQHLPCTGRTKAQFLRARQLDEGQIGGKLLQKFSGPWDGAGGGSSTTPKKGQANPLSIQVLTESQNTRGKADQAQERTPLF